MHTDKLVIATQNSGKLEEYQNILSPLNIGLESLADYGVQIQAEETGLTFRENALIKAHFGFKQTNVPCLADDSGLTIDALNGEPGIHSARYGEPTFNDAQRVELILNNMKDIPAINRTARFICCIAVVGLTDIPLIVQGSISGAISLTPSGNHGFGYDPIFYLPTLKTTMANLNSETKNNISHRGDAAWKLLKILNK
ncbi:MAG TPA: non-canonical purine NTP pyrophosphatase, RdgB/HAM1 family [Dehalococcoidia bacterium]|jgi:XTP/dITP diphosphohydrolase|nr:non-canonical purine NTP pyrophosphatase, RdgB/HAM1 family [Dehalococcoidia bacterium]